MAPLRKGGNVNLLNVPENEAALDLATCAIDPSRDYGYVAALRRDRRSCSATSSIAGNTHG